MVTETIHKYGLTAVIEYDKEDMFFLYPLDHATGSYFARIFDENQEPIHEFWGTYDDYDAAPTVLKEMRDITRSGQTDARGQYLLENLLFCE